MTNAILILITLFVVVIGINAFTAEWLKSSLVENSGSETWQVLFIKLSSLTVAGILLGSLAGKIGLDDIYLLLIGSIVFVGWWSMTNTFKELAQAALITNLPTLAIAKIAMSGDVLQATEVAVTSLIGLLFMTAVVVGFRVWKLNTN